MSRQRDILHERAIPTLYGPLTSLKIYLLRHLQVFFYSIGKLSLTPLATFMTAAVIGIALALPTGLYVLLQNVQQLSRGWDGATQISLFLKTDISDTHAKKLQARLQTMPELSNVVYISRKQALAEFKRLSGYGEALTVLNENPLPSVLIAQPSQQHNSPQASTRLLQKLQNLPNVELAQLDMQWVKRLYAIMGIVERGIMILSLLLALAVTLVVGNTIRLSIHSRRDEIIVIKLIGGTNAFIRRPFLYSGFWYGLFGGIIAFILVTLSIVALDSPINKLTSMYHNQFELQGLGLKASLYLGLLGILLGLIGSWLAVGRHLRDIEPS